MVYETITMENEQGMHLRPAMNFAARMSGYDSRIRLESGDRTADGKSLVSLISAGICTGAQVHIVCDGPDEEEMLRSAADLLRGTIGL